jgi:hypothetical protein
MVNCEGGNGIEQVRLAGILADVGAADGHGDDLGARSIDGGARFGEILVLAGADQQTGTVRLAGDGQLMHGELLSRRRRRRRFRVGRRRRAQSLRAGFSGTISPLRSTAMRLPA